MAELGDFLVSGDTTVNIDVEMLDYGFIEKCDDAKTLRGIIDTLKSGKEGIYPELCQAAENRLFAVIPEKERKRILRLKHQTTPDQIHDAECDLNSWQTEVFAVDKELLGCKTEVSSTKTKKIPPVRGQKVEKLDIPGPVPSKAPAGNIKSEDDSASSSLKSQRLSGYDFHAWEKFNVDEALATLDEEEEELEKDALTKRLKNKRIAEEAAKKRVERHTKALEVLRVEMNIENMSTVQRKTRAAREKQKGNESFRSGENEEAYTYYSRSLALDDSVAAVYSNRALVCLRTGKLETAEDDCSRALFLEPGFTKARSRRGIARLKSGKYELAILDFEYALEYDSTNKELVSLLQKAKDKYLEVEGKEYVSKKERERQDAALRLALANGMPVKVTSSSSSEALLLPVASASVELVSSGVCGMIADPSEKLTRITIEDDSASSDDEEHGVESGGFTRIVIDEDSDSEDEDNVDDGVIAQDKTAAPVDNSSSTNGFVRIAITDDSDSDSDSKSENNEQHEVVADKVSQVQIAEKLKSQANEAMQGGDLSKAIRLYTECIAIDATSQVGIAACGNRSLANLKLKNYANVLEDTNLVLTHDPFNLKALYRRAMAFEATNDLDSAIKDVNAIVHIQPQNELALEARERFLSAQKAAIVETNDIDVAAKSTPIESDWEVVSSTDSGKVSTVPADLEKGNELKNLGNEAMKAGRIEEAVDFYSQAITCDSSNVLFYNNRAQAYIKIGQFKKAEVDATHVIDHNTDDAPNFKAYYRRALARKGLNTSTSLKGAQGDIAFILTHEPNNKAAIIENQKIGKLLKAIVVKKKDESIITKEPVKSGSITSSGLTEVSSKKVKARSDTPLSSQPSLSSQSHESPRSEVSTKKPAANVPTTSKTKAAKDITVKNPTVPEAPPKTVYEFERIWRGLKNRPDLFAIYLKCFKKSTFKKVLKETCSPDLLSSMLVSVRDYLLASERREDVEKGVSVLDGLASIPKYDMVRFVLPEADLECLKSCLDFVNVHVGAERASNLRNKLKV